MMVSETFQLRAKFEVEDVDIIDDRKLCLIILKQISLGEIESVHFTKEEAIMACKLLEHLDEVGDRRQCICKKEEHNLKIKCERK
jgi:hypothetical protein